MSDDLITYCGLYCGLCAERCLLPSKSRELRELVKDEGYDLFHEHVPGMKDHYPSFVKMLEDLSVMDCKCRDGSGGPPGCEIRACAKGRGLFVCMECEDHPCDKWNSVAKSYPFLIIDAFRYQDVGKERWTEEQREKGRKGFNYRMMRRIEVQGGEEKEEG